MHITVNGKRINLIKTLHLTNWSDKRESHELSFVIFDEYDKDSGDYIKNQVLYFNENELEEFGMGL